MQPLHPEDLHLLTDLVGDSPERVIASYVLRSGQGQAWAWGEPPYEAAAIEWNSMRKELLGFGDPTTLWRLLQELAGWTCVLVHPQLATPLADLFEGSRMTRDFDYILKTPSVVPSQSARMLSSDDEQLMMSSVDVLNLGDADWIRRLLATGWIAGAERDGRLVSRALCMAHTDTYGDIGIHTAPGNTGLGLATACTSVLSRKLLEMGITPVWGASESNIASRRVAEKCGFEEIGYQVFVIPRAE